MALTYDELVAKYNTVLEKKNRYEPISHKKLVGKYLQWSLNQFGALNRTNLTNNFKKVFRNLYV